MVQVLENKLVSLDVLPGTDRIEAQKQLREKLAEGQDAAQAAIETAASQAHGGTGSAASAAGVGEGGQQKTKISEDEYASMSPVEKEQAKSTGAQIVDGTGKVLYSLGSTVGGVVKGVGDTVGDVVVDVGGGLGKVGTSAVGGLYGAASAPFKQSGAAEKEEKEKAAAAETAAREAAGGRADTGHVPVELEDREE
jgi:hypothetical protein